MGQLGVRLAIQSAIENAQVPFVGTVFAARAYINEQDYEQNASGFYVSSANGSSCVVVVNLPGPDKRMRRALTGRGAVNDTNIHPVALELFFASKGNSVAQTDQLVAAQLDYDQVVDGLVVFIRNNPTMSAPEEVWSAGEYKAGVVHHQSEPFTDEEGMTTFIVGTIRFEAWEWLAGSGGI